MRKNFLLHLIFFFIIAKYIVLKSKIGKKNLRLLTKISIDFKDVLFLIKVIYIILKKNRFFTIKKTNKSLIAKSGRELLSPNFCIKLLISALGIENISIL